nr:MAG TPA: hypothetical protein [Caudoviricetes sp.]
MDERYSLISYKSMSSLEQSGDLRNNCTIDLPYIIYGEISNNCVSVNLIVCQTVDYG